MKLKLLLCYALVVSTVCFSAAPAVEEEEDDETAEIVSDPLAAMGRAPRAVVKKISNQNSASMGNISGTDPYAMAKQNALPAVPVGDPYAATMVKVDLPQGDPYSSIGVPVSQLAVSKKIEKPKTGKPHISNIPTANTKNVAKMLATPKVPTTLASTLFKSTGSNDPEAQAAVLEIERQVKNQENQLQLVAKQNLVLVTQAISEQAEQLREEADAAARVLKAKTENRVQELIDTAGKQIDDLNKKVAQKSTELKQEAAQRAFLVLDDIEERAAEKRQQERKLALAKTFGLSNIDLAFEEIPAKKKTIEPGKQKISKKGEELVRAPLKDTEVVVAKKPSDSTANSVPVELVPVSSALRVSAEWKNDLSRQFYRDMATMKDIILEAESPSESQDFLKKFEAQNKWFDTTLRSTRAVTDEQYKQLSEKQAQMGRLMQGQRIADDYLQKFTKNMIMEPLQLKKVRLNVLYELNAKMQQRASHLDRAIRESGLPDDDVKNLVKRTLSEVSQQFREIAAQFPDVEIGGMSGKTQLSLAAVPLAAQQLELELNKAKDLALETQQQLEAAKQELAAAQDAVAQTQAALDKEREEKEVLVKDTARIKTTALQLVDKQSHDNIDTELSLAGAKQDVAAVKTELALASQKNMQFAEQKRQFVGSLEVARKEAMQASLLRSDYVNQAQKAMFGMQRQTKEQIKFITESGARRELALMTDLRQAQEKIAALTAKHAKLIQDLEMQYNKTIELKNSLKMAQEAMGKAESQADLNSRSIAENGEIIKRQMLLRKQAQERTKITEALAQQTLDSISGFLEAERKNGGKKLITSTQDRLKKMSVDSKPVVVVKQLAVKQTPRQIPGYVVKG